MKEGNLLKWDDYYSRYCYYLGEGYTCNKAFEKVQYDFVEQTGLEKIEVTGYSSLDSFRVSVSNKLSKNK